MISQDLAAPAALLPLAGFASYLRGTLRGTTRPNRVSWALWATAPLIAFAAQIAEGTSLRLSLVTFVLGLGPTLIFAASFASPRAYWRLGRFDCACAAIACAAIAAWALTRRGDVAIALAIATDMCAALPTIAKSWSHPASESAGTYIASGTGAAITLLTVRHWQFAACAFSAYVVAVCAVITVLIVLPRTAAGRGYGGLHHSGRREALTEPDQHQSVPATYHHRAQPGADRDPVAVSQRHGAVLPADTESYRALYGSPGGLGGRSYPTGVMIICGRT